MNEPQENASTTRSAPFDLPPGALEAFAELVATVARLRAPDGCPWDREQTHASIARNMTEEAAEAVDAIERGDVADMREELGDVLLQALLQAQMAREAAEFDLSDVLQGLTDKLVRRHPHVFGTEAALAATHLEAAEEAALREQIQAASSPEAVLDLWDQIKLLEKRQAAIEATKQAVIEAADNAELQVKGLLDSVPKALPALMQAQDISRKAISVGFEWESTEAVWQQVASELEEYRAEEVGSARAAEEFGDLLFSLVNVARREGVDAESALRSSCQTFRRRWAIMERRAREQGRELAACRSEELEELWQEAKIELARA